MVQQQLALLRMRSTFDVFSPQAEITAQSQGTTLTLCWRTATSTARLTADFADTTFHIEITDSQTGTPQYQFQQG